MFSPADRPQNDDSAALTTRLVNRSEAIYQTAEQALYNGAEKMSPKIDKSLERKMFFHETDVPPENCPRCSQRLVQDSGPYQIATRSGRRLTDEFMMSGDFGYLCPGCATAVIHVNKLADMLYGIPMKPGWKAGPEFTVLGLVDLDAIPPDQSDVPIDELDPYPLVPFEAANVPSENRPARKKRPRKPKPKRRK